MFSKTELDRFFRYCVSLTGDEDNAYDLLYKCLEKFLKDKRKKVNHPVKYFFRMIRNQFVDDFRRNNSLQVEELNEKVTVVDIHGRTLEDVTLDQKEVEYLFGKLSGLERELLYLWAVEGYTIEEISDIQDVPKNTLLSRIHRLRKKMDVLLSREKRITG